MKTRNRLFAILLAFAMVTTYMPALAFADDEATAAEAGIELNSEDSEEVPAIVGGDKEEPNEEVPAAAETTKGDSARVQAPDRSKTANRNNDDGEVPGYFYDCDNEKYVTINDTVETFELISDFEYSPEFMANPHGYFSLELRDNKRGAFSVSNEETSYDQETDMIINTTYIKTKAGLKEGNYSCDIYEVYDSEGTGNYSVEKYLTTLWLYVRSYDQANYILEVSPPDFGEIQAEASQEEINNQFEGTSGVSIRNIGNGPLFVSKDSYVINTEDSDEEAFIINYSEDERELNYDDTWTGMTVLPKEGQAPGQYRLHINVTDETGYAEADTWVSYYIVSDELTIKANTSAINYNYYPEGNYYEGLESVTISNFSKSTFNRVTASSDTSAFYVGIENAESDGSIEWYSGGDVYLNIQPADYDENNAKEGIITITATTAEGQTATIEIPISITVCDSGIPASIAHFYRDNIREQTYSTDYAVYDEEEDNYPTLFYVDFENPVEENYSDYLAFDIGGEDAELFKLESGLENDESWLHVIQAEPEIEAGVYTFTVNMYYNKEGNVSTEGTPIDTIDLTLTLYDPDDYRLVLLDEEGNVVEEDETPAEYYDIDLGALAEGYGAAAAAEHSKALTLRNDGKYEIEIDPECFRFDDGISPDNSFDISFTDGTKVLQVGDTYSFNIAPALGNDPGRYELGFDVYSKNEKSQFQFYADYRVVSEGIHIEFDNGDTVPDEQGIIYADLGVNSTSEENPSPGTIVQVDNAGTVSVELSIADTTRGNEGFECYFGEGKGDDWGTEPEEKPIKKTLEPGEQAFICIMADYEALRAEEGVYEASFIVKTTALDEEGELTDQITTNTINATYEISNDQYDVTIDYRGIGEYENQTITVAKGTTLYDAMEAVFDEEYELETDGFRYIGWTTVESGNYATWDEYYEQRDIDESAVVRENMTVYIDWAQEIDSVELQFDEPQCGDTIGDISQTFNIVSGDHCSIESIECYAYIKDNDEFRRIEDDERFDADNNYNYNITLITDFGWTGNRDAQYTVNGNNVWGSSWNGGININSSVNLWHDIVQVAGVRATCETTGLRNHYECSGCGKLYSDREGIQLADLFTLTIPAKGHNYGDLIAQVEPTETEDGILAHYECSRCNKLFVMQDDVYVEKTADELVIPAGQTTEELIPVGLEYSGELSAYDGLDYLNDNLDHDGASCTILFSNGTSKHYEYSPESGEFISADNDCALLWWEFADNSNTQFSEANNEIRIYISSYHEQAYYDVYTTATVRIDPCPVKIATISFEPADASNYLAMVNGASLSNFPAEGDRLTINYADNTSTEYTYSEDDGQFLDPQDKPIPNDYYFSWEFTGNRKTFIEGLNTLQFYVFDYLWFDLENNDTGGNWLPDQGDSDLILNTEYKYTSEFTVQTMLSDVDSIRFISGGTKTMEEYVDCYDVCEADGTKWFKYALDCPYSEDDQLIVKYTGDSTEYTYSATYDEETFFEGIPQYYFETSDNDAPYQKIYPDVYDDQSAENVWGLGDHSFTINFNGAESSIPVTVVEHVHDNLYYIDPMEPTCTQSGHIGYWECSICSRGFADENAETMLWNKDVVRPALGHNYVSGVCTRCGDTLEVLDSGDYWTLYTNGLLVLDDTEDYTCTEIDYNEYTVDTPWYEYRESILSVVINPGVTRIGNYTLWECSNMTSIIIPDSVTSIGYDAFRKCSSLTSITIPDSVTSIENGAFTYCTGLTSVTIPDGVTVIEMWTFGDCSNLTSVTIPNSVTNIEDLAFTRCSSLASIMLPNNLTQIGNRAFWNCTSLTSIVIPDGVTTIETWAFDGCTSLTSVTIPASVTNVGSAIFTGFTGATSLEDVYYGGTKAQWEALGINVGSATVHYGAQDVHTHNDIDFTAWTSTDSLPATVGNYYLTEDVTLNAAWSVPTGTVDLCLNGHTISLAEEKYSCVINIKSTATLNLYDCGENGAIAGGHTTAGQTYDCGGVNIDGTFNMYGGIISGNNGQKAGGVVVNSEGSIFNMYGGKITNNIAHIGTDTSSNGEGGGVLIKLGTFNMYDGEISNNKAGRGGGIAMWYGVLNMYGGTISGNMSTYGGGGIQSTGGSYGSINLYGGSITDNNVWGTGGGGLYTSGAAINISGSIVIDNNTRGAREQKTEVNVANVPIINVIGPLEDASIGITLSSDPTCNSPVVLTSGLSGNGDASAFFSDQGYTVSLTNDGEAQITGPHDWNTGEVTTPATCTTAGVKTFTCTVCGETKTEEIPIDSTAHTWGAWTDCEDGEHHQRVCANDRTHKETAAHSWNTGEVTTPATCLVDGVKTFTCTDCGATKTEAVQATGHHTVETWTVTKAATCSETGTKTGECTVCHETVTEEIPIDANAHSWGEWTDCEDGENHQRACANDSNHVDTKPHEWNAGEVTTAATCLANGVKTFTCTDCGATKTEAIPAAGHHNVETWTVTKAATCSETGTKAGECTVCHETVTEEIPIDPNAHAWGEWVMTKSPTCSTAGEETRTCQHDASHTEKHSTDIDPEAHVWGEWTVTKAATCCEGGEETRICGIDPSHFQKRGTEVDPNAHAWGDWAVTKAATCCEGGEETRTCQHDATHTEKRSTEVDPNAHAWGNWTDCGDGENHQRVCAHNNTHKETAPHSWNTGEITTPATCLTDGVKTFTCTDCGATKTEIINALGHDWAEPEWTWAEDHSSANAKITCKNDSSHTETVNAEVTTSVDESGNTVYTAKVSIEGKEYTETITEEKLQEESIRLSGSDRYDTAIKAADEYKAATNSKFKNVVVAYGQDFPDALAGGYLAKVKNAPILLVKTSVENQIVDYISKNIASGGTVYILGGTGVVSSSFEKKVKAKGITTERLGGKDRYETNRLILQAAGVTNQDILVCTGKDYADSLSASAIGLPILLVDKDLKEDQKAYLNGLSTSKFYLIGGTGAVKPAIESDLRRLGYSNIERLAGGTRYETSTAVAKKFFPKVRTVMLAYAKNFPDGLSGGPLAMINGSPIILTDSGKTAAAQAYVKTAEAIRSITLGGTSLISDAAVRAIMGR